MEVKHDQCVVIPSVLKLLITRHALTTQNEGIINIK